jgi:hypothetical protein
MVICRKIEILLLVGLGMAGCGGGDIPIVAPTDQVNLKIPDRAWDRTRPDLDVGWCGETCIQMAMGFYGKEVSQKAINAAAGSPSDVTEDNMDIALNALGVQYVAWDESNTDLAQFMAWIQDQLRKGYPVICGLKIYPEEHPDWYVDHFVLAVGFDKKGLLLNTQLDCDGQVNVSYSQLGSRNEGYSFRSNLNRYFGRVITGVR